MSGKIFSLKNKGSSLLAPASISTKINRFKFIQIIQKINCCIIVPGIKFFRKNNFQTSLHCICRGSLVLVCDKTSMFFDKIQIKFVLGYVEKT
jgi:predicted amidohydrolase